MTTNDTLTVAHYLRNTLLAIALPAAFMGNAQQALWGFSTINSPEVNADGSVTFRYLAPDAKSVKLTGDFILPRDGAPKDSPAAMQLEMTSDGIWQCTTPPLAPELYSYSFIVDGVKTGDPSNVFLIRDTATVTNVFLVGGGQADLYKVNDVPHGTVSKVWYESPSLGCDRRMTVYTPPGYEKENRSYPVLYLLHGMGGDENAWSELGRATCILDNLIARGEAEPMIVVMPNGNVAMEGAPGETSLGFKQPSTRLAHTMDGIYEEHFPEIMRYVETNYRTLPDKSHRAIAGLSMGKSET